MFSAKTTTAREVVGPAPRLSPPFDKDMAVLIHFALLQNHSHGLEETHHCGIQQERNRCFIVPFVDFAPFVLARMLTLREWITNTGG